MSILAKFEAGMESMLDTFVFETSSLLEELDDILMRTENDELLRTSTIYRETYTSQNKQSHDSKMAAIALDGEAQGEEVDA